jgi:WD40 repeat protein
MTEERSGDAPRGPLIQAASFSPDGRWLVTGSLEGVVALWDVGTGRRLRVLLDPQRVEDRQQEAGSFAPGSECIRRSSILCLALSADGRRLAVGAANGIVVVWNTESWREIHFWRPHDFGVTALEFSPDGRWLATGCAETGMTTLRVWRMDGASDLPDTEAFSSDRMGGVFALAFSPDGRFLVFGGWGYGSYSAPRIYELATGEEICLLPLEVTRALCYSPDGELLASGDESGTVSLSKIATGKRAFERTAHTRIVKVVAFSPDGRRLVSGGLDGGMKIWEVGTGDLLAEHAYGGSVLTCRFSAVGAALLVAEAARGADHPTIHRLPWGASRG